MLDDARLTAANNPNRVISFTGNIIFITTNLGSEVYEHKKRFDGEDDSIDIEVVYKALADDDRFETAVLGRIDDIVPLLSKLINVGFWYLQILFHTSLRTEPVKTMNAGVPVTPNGM